METETQLITRIKILEIRHKRMVKLFNESPVVALMDLRIDLAKLMNETKDLNSYTFRIKLEKLNREEKRLTKVFEDQQLLFKNLDAMFSLARQIEQAKSDLWSLRRRKLFS